MSYNRVACVTGANKGIGLAIVRQLALQYPKSSLNNGPLLIYLTARDESRGRKALEELRKDPLLKRDKALSSDGGLADVEYHALDISDEGSIRAFRDFLKEKHPDGVDIVVNNAAVALDGFNAQIVRNTMHSNYYGTITAMRSFLEILRPSGGRMVNVSSAAGKLSRFSPQLSKRFSEASKIENVNSIVEDFQKAVERGTEKEEGFMSAAYGTSKAALNAATRIIAGEAGGKVLLNACHPGFVNTDMTKGRGVKTIDEGAETPVHLALGDIGGRTGLYWSDKRVEDF